MYLRLISKKVRALKAEKSTFTMKNLNRRITKSFYKLKILKTDFAKEENTKNNNLVRF